MLSSFLLNSRGLIRLTCWGVTSICVGKKRFPFVHRLATNTSPALLLLGELGGVLIQFREMVMNLSCGNACALYTHSSAPFFQIQIYPTTRIAKKISISINPNSPSALNRTAQGNKKIVSTSNTTKRIAMM